MASLIREAIDERFGAITPDDRLRALEDIRRLEGHFLAPDELDRLVESERDAVLDRGPR